jgi:hypothetical protein
MLLYVVNKQHDTISLTFYNPNSAKLYIKVTRAQGSSCYVVRLEGTAQPCINDQAAKNYLWLRNIVLMSAGFCPVLA